MIDELFVKTFKRRSVILGIGKSILIGGLLGRLIQLQIFNRKHYQTLADRNRIQTRLIAAPRGQILDHQGKVLAINENMYRCLISPIASPDVAETVLLLQKILELSDQEKDALQRQLIFQTKIASVVKDNLSWEEMAALQLEFYKLPGLIIERSQIRKYLHPNALSHVIGYVAQASDKDLATYNLEPIPGLRVGQNGLEKSYQPFLEGKPGKQQVEVNARGRIVRILDNISSKPGKDLHLTLNLDLQLKTAEVLSAHQRAAAVVMDVESGAIKALVSTPGYDSNTFVQGVQKKSWQELLYNEDRPLINKVIAGQYAPGSTFKMMVGLAGLKAGIDPSASFFCPGHYDLGNHRFHCWTWKTGGHGYVNLESAISRSCDVYFYHVALQVGTLKIVEMAQKFFLGQLTGIELKGEKKGLLPTPEWAKIRKEFFKQKGQALNVSIGQGVVLSTPLQLARMVTMIANKGKIIKPHLVASEAILSDAVIQDIEPEWWEWISSGMANCLNQPGGTAFHAKPNIKDWTIACKTGSSQVSRITMQQRQDGTYKDLPYHLRDHACFVGFAPVEEPKYAISVIVEHGMSGGRVAAPLGVEILLAAKEYCER